MWHIKLNKEHALQTITINMNEREVQLQGFIIKQITHGKEIIKEIKEPYKRWIGSVLKNWWRNLINVISDKISNFHKLKEKNLAKTGR
jgi:hypothetical protein